MISLRRTPIQRCALRRSSCLSLSHLHSEKFSGGTTMTGYAHGRHTSTLTSIAKAALGLLLGAVSIALCVPCPSYAQDTGYISGTVIDKSGAAIAGADVTVTNTGGNLTRTTTTNGDGAYNVAGLPRGSYNLSGAAKGLQKYTAQNIKLDV